VIEPPRWAAKEVKIENSLACKRQGQVPPPLFGESTFRPFLGKSKSFKSGAIARPAMPAAI